MIAEGLVYLLAPHALETLLKALENSVDLCAPANGGFALPGWVHFLGVEPLDARQTQ